MMLARGGGYGAPLQVDDYAPFAPGFQDTTGKVPVDSAVVPGERTLILLVIGQSIPANTCSGTPYVPVSPRVHNFNIYDRKTYLASGPLLGCVNGPSPPLHNFVTEMGDRLILDGTCDRTILMPTNIGATSMAMWGAGGLFNKRLRVGLRCAPLFGAPISAVLILNGEEDNGRGTTAAQYCNSFNEVKATIRGMGCNAPIFMPTRETMLEGITSSVIQGAQSSLINGTDVLAGADMDSVLERQADGTHLTDVGGHHAASLWKAAISAHF